MLAGDADVVIYAAAANLRPAEAIADMASILRAGTNVVSCSVVPLVFPDAVDAAYVEGRAAFAVDHVTRMHDEIAPDWPQPHISIPPRDFGYGAASGRGVYRVEIAGSPSMRCEFEMAEHHDHDLGARMAGASRMVNVVPAVCEAPPGLLSALDLPLVTGAGLVRPVAGPSPDSRLFGF